MIHATAYGSLEHDARFHKRTADQESLTTFILRVLGRGAEHGSTTYIRCSIGGRYGERMAPSLNKGKRVLIGGPLALRERADGQQYLTMRLQTLEFLDPSPRGRDVEEE